MKISTKKYIDNQVRWLEKVTKARFEGQEKAVDKLEHTTGAKFDGVNEFRGQLKDQASTFVTRRELWGAVITTITILLAAIALINKI